MPYKKDFKPRKVIKSAEINTNFSVIISTMFVYGENHTAQVNGVAMVFTSTHPYFPNTLRVYENGKRLRRIVDYIEISDTQYTLTVAPIVGQDLQVDYMNKNI